MGQSGKAFQQFREQMASIAEQIEAGELDAMPEYADIYSIEKESKAIKAQFEAYAANEAKNYDSKELKTLGYTSKSGSRRYSYKGILEVDELTALHKESMLNIQNKYKSLTSQMEEIEVLEVEMEGLSNFGAESGKIESLQRKIESDKNHLITSFEVLDYEELYNLCPEISFTKDSLIYKQPKKY